MVAQQKPCLPPKSDAFQIEGGERSLIGTKFEKKSEMRRRRRRSSRRTVGASTMRRNCAISAPTTTVRRLI